MWGRGVANGDVGVLGMANGTRIPLQRTTAPGRLKTEAHLLI